MATTPDRTPGTKYRSPSGEIKTYGYPDGTPYESGDGGDGGNGLSEGENQADALLARQRAESAALLQRQKEEGERQFQAAKARSEEALSSFRTTIGGLEKPEDIYGRIGGELGIPGIMESTKGLRQSISSAEGQLRALPEATRESLRGSLVTEGQRQRLISKESIPITEQLQVLSRTLGVESANLSEAMSAAITQTQFAIQGQERTLEPERLNIQQVAQLNQQRLAMFSETAARELTAFNTGREAELSVLAEKLQNARTLSDQEFQRALTLANSEREFENMKEQLRLQSQLNMDETKLQQGLLGARELALQLAGAGQDESLETLKATTPSTAGERTSAALQGASGDIESILSSERNEGAGGDFTTIAAYRDAKRKALQAGVTASEFKKQYAERLSPDDRITYGIGSTTNVGTLDDTDDPLD